MRKKEKEFLLSWDAYFLNVKITNKLSQLLQFSSRRSVPGRRSVRYFYKMKSYQNKYYFKRLY